MIIEYNVNQEDPIMIARSMARDRRLTLAALGLLVFLNDAKANGISMKNLAIARGETIEDVTAYMVELGRLGYISISVFDDE